MSQNISAWDRIGQDLWPHHCEFLVKKALEAREGEHIYLSDGEAETLARQETEREITKRLKPHPNYLDIDL
jgi:hypothetical protein